MSDGTEAYVPIWGQNDLHLEIISFRSSSLPVRMLWLIAEIRRTPAIALPTRHLEKMTIKIFFINKIFAMNSKKRFNKRRSLDMQQKLNANYWRAARSKTHRSFKCAAVTCGKNKFNETFFKDEWETTSGDITQESIFSNLNWE